MANSGNLARWNKKLTKTNSAPAGSPYESMNALPMRPMMLLVNVKYAPTCNISKQ
jgi:hypothetical protein